MVTLKYAEDVMVESTYLRNLETVSGELAFDALSIDRAVVSSARSDLFCDRSKSRRDNPAAKPLARAYMPFREGRSPRGSVGYNRNISNVFAQAFSRSRIPHTLKRSM
jgi:hypothetical protein